MKTLQSLCAIAATIIAAPASATSYDAFTSFNATQGAGGFTYGTVDLADRFNLTLFGASTNCFIAGSICLQKAADFNVPGVTKSSATSFQYGTVNVPNDRLLMHPGPSDGGSVVIEFTIPRTGNWTLAANFRVQDINPSGLDIYEYRTGHSAPFSVLVAILNASNSGLNMGGSDVFYAGEKIGFILDRAGDFANDSTGVNFSLSYVPEPASWALLIVGFGLTGAAMRRRRSVAVTA